MNKIDLHIHNKNVFSGEKNRDITPERFKKILKETGIMIGAITNHHYFEKEFFEKYTDEKYLLLPGMEINIEDEKNEKAQLNVIFSEKETLKLEKIYIKYFKSLDKNGENDKIKIEDFIKIFDDLKIIIFVDHKNESRVSEKTINILKKQLQKSYILYDTNSAINYRRLVALEKDTLIGSDVKDWDNYVKDSEKLISTYLKIKKFETFYGILTKKQLFDIVKNIEKNDLEIEIDKDNFLIPIYDGLNIIIGDKATGKTKILEYIEKINEKKGIPTSSFYTTEKEKNYEEIINSSSIFYENQSKELEIKEKIKKICESDWEKPDPPSSFLKSINEISKSKILIHKIDKFKVLTTNFNEIKKLNLSINELEENIKNFYQNLSIKNEEKKELISKNIKILNKIQENSIEYFINDKENKDDISKNIINQIINQIKIEINKKGLTSDKQNIGLFDKYRWMQQIKTIKNEIMKISLNKNEEEEMNYESPDMGKIYFIEKNNIIDFKSIVNKKNSGNHKVKEWNENIYPFFNTNDYTSKKIFENFKKYWSENNEEVIWHEKIILNDKKEKINLSSGQKYLFLIMIKLNKKVEYFILDEPSAHLGSNTVMKSLNKKIVELKKQRKKVIIATHNPNLGISSIPNSIIFRQREGKYKTFWAHITHDYFEEINDEKEKTKLPFEDVTINMFEGGKNEYDFRKVIYEKNN